ncbi:hypothetical protein BGX38DRAFT_1148595 [Terfezia claveryi]|nr:hypothetical protein BGX38DRAFT_1148595 [Terfezia claveryi]
MYPVILLILLILSLILPSSIYCYIHPPRSRLCCLRPQRLPLILQLFVASSSRASLSSVDGRPSRPVAAAEMTAEEGMVMVVVVAEIVASASAISASKAAHSASLMSVVIGGLLSGVGSGVRFWLPMGRIVGMIVEEEVVEVEEVSKKSAGRGGPRESGVF